MISSDVSILSTTSSTQGNHAYQVWMVPQDAAPGAEDSAHQEVNEAKGWEIQATWKQQA